MLDIFRRPFQDGDKVRIISHKPADWEDGPKWVSSMDVTCGKTGVVTGVEKYDMVYVRVDEEEGRWRYKVSWVAHIDETPRAEDPDESYRQKRDANLASVFT